MWKEIGRHEVADWNGRLQTTSAHCRQYPYWNAPYESLGFKVYYLVWEPGKETAAYVCVLVKDLALFRLGLVQRGPVSLQSGATVGKAALQDLILWAKAHGCAFLRFTHSDLTIIKVILDAGESREIEAYPFYRDPPRSLLIEQTPDDERTLTSFQEVARRGIKAARRACYSIKWSDSPEALRQ